MDRDNGLALGISVYSDGSDCTNGGLSARVAERGLNAYAVGTEAVPMEGYARPEELAASPARNALFRLERNALGNVVLVADPTDEQVAMADGDAQRLIGPMMGGNYGATSDSRWAAATGMYGAIPIHDRYETRAQYDSLSR